MEQVIGNSHVIVQDDKKVEIKKIRNGKKEE